MIDWGTDKELKRFISGSIIGAYILLGIEMVITLAGWLQSKELAITTIFILIIALACVLFAMSLLGSSELRRRARKQFRESLDNIKVQVERIALPPTYRIDGSHTIQDPRKCTHFVEGDIDYPAPGVVDAEGDKCNHVSGPRFCEGTQDDRCPLPRVDPSTRVVERDGPTFIFKEMGEVCPYCQKPTTPIKDAAGGGIGYMCTTPGCPFMGI